MTNILHCPKCKFRTTRRGLMWVHTTLLNHCKHDYILVEDSYRFCRICGG